ncbi:MAG: T9SS type A sorting domain-containing protein [Haliscomenobacter sp.]|nr:T9SS type A sorting domain-containing protein [Haliscomenobacter sp.]
MKQPLLQSLDDLAFPVYAPVCPSKRQKGASWFYPCAAVLAFLLFSSPLVLQAQSLSPQVFGSAGGAVLHNGVRINWTLGEAAVSRVYADNAKGSVTEGFHQPALQIKPASGLQALQVSIAPNPVLSVLNLGLPASVTSDVTATISDAQGNVVLNRVQLKPGSTELDLSLFPAGMYFLTIRQADQPAGQTYKVVKLN